MRLAVAERQAGQSATKYLVQAGEKIILVQGLRLVGPGQYLPRPGLCETAQVVRGRTAIGAAFKNTQITVSTGCLFERSDHPEPPQINIVHAGCCTFAGTTTL